MRKAIALLITVMSVMIISVAIGYGLTQLQTGAKSLSEEEKAYQYTMLLDDLLEILESSDELAHLAESDASEELYLFLENSRYLSFLQGERKVVVSFASARSKLNINTFNKSNAPLFRSYFSRHMIANGYVDILRECMHTNQVKEGYNNSYKSALFEKHPELFRDYIASKEHLEIINAFYMQEYGDEALGQIPFEKLFSYSLNPAQEIDLNYATAEVLELILGTTRERALEIKGSGLFYKSFKNMGLSKEEEQNIAHFRTTFFAPFLAVHVLIVTDERVATIDFEYDIQQKRGYNFVFEL